MVLLCATGGLGKRKNVPYVVHRWYAMPGYSDTPYEECNGLDGKVSKVQVIPCEIEDDACILKAGANATIKIDFTSKVASPTLKAVVHGIVGSIPIPFHIPQGNACNSGVQCPIEPSTSYNYVAQIPVLKTYPRLSVKVKWELVDKQNKDVACVIIPAKIRS
jgi:hypothetical protein